MLTSLLIFVPLAVAVAAEKSSAGLLFPSSTLKEGLMNGLPTSNLPRNLPIVLDSAGLISSSSSFKPTAAQNQAAVTATSQLLHSIEGAEERVTFREPLLGLTRIPYTTQMTITVSCELNHTLYRCDMPMHGLTREVCMTAKGQVLCHVPMPTPTSSAASDAVGVTTTTSLPTLCIPAATIASHTVLTSCEPQKGSALMGKVSVASNTSTKVPTTVSSGNVALVSTMPTTLGSSHTLSSASLSAGAARHSGKTTKPVSSQKVNAASSLVGASFSQVLVAVIIGMALLVSL